MSILASLQAIVAILLILSILIQQRASGLSATFGGAGSSYVQRRGAEKMIFKFSVWLSVIFFALAVLQWYVYI